MSWPEALQRIDLGLSTAVYVLLIAGVLAPLVFVVSGLFSSWRHQIAGDRKRRATDDRDAWSLAGERAETPPETTPEVSPDEADDSDDEDEGEPGQNGSLRRGDD
ncbi:hypothetical protein [Mucisphaera sp.]|uniref:hypothetical protein n=1 Tax=Mucisphaera sp. TaxID=2913024 RepID=UPI003D1128BC